MIYKRLRFILVIVYLLVVFPCISKNSPTFSVISSTHSLNGVYYDTELVFAKVFSIDSLKSNVFKIDFKDNSTLQIYNFNGDDFEHIRTYQGKYLTKENYFQVTFEKTRKLYVLYNVVSNNYVRIGKDKEGKLMIYNKQDHFGNLLILANGNDSENTYHINTIAEKDLIPFNKNNKWGYCTINGKIKIPLVYDAASPFSDNKAIVIKDGKSAYINTAGENLTPFYYDRIGNVIPQSKSIIVYQNNKQGIMNEEGEELTPPVFDDIEYYRSNSNKKFLRVRNEQKYGITHVESGVIYPAVFDEIILFEKPGFKSGKTTIPNAIARVTININYKNRQGTSRPEYIADDEGYLYLIYKKLVGEGIAKDSKKKYEDVIKELDKTEK